MRAKILSLTRRMVAMIELRWSSVDATVVFDEVGEGTMAERVGGLMNKKDYIW